MSYVNSLPDFRVDTLRRKLFFCTVRIVGTSTDDDQYYSEGTGFIYDTSRTPGVVNPVLVTARHVIEGSTQLKVRLLLQKGNGNPDLGRFEDMTMSGGGAGFFHHPDASVDVSVFPLGLPLTVMSMAQRPVFAVSLSNSLCPKPADLEQIDAVEEVVFVGYPDALYDTSNQTPIARRGVTATPIQLDWRGRAQFLIDAAVFPGSSGSPVMLLQQAARLTPTGLTITAAPRAYFLGVLTSVYDTPADVERRGGGRSTGTVRIGLGLGLVEKWSAVEETIDAMYASAGVKRDALTPPQFQLIPTQPGPGPGPGPAATA